MVLGRKRHECIAAPSSPRLMGSRLVPTPRCFHRAAIGSPWLAIDPVLRTDCMAFCRSARLAFVAVFALLGLSKMACAAEPAANNAPTGIANLLPQNGKVEVASAVECANQNALKVVISTAHGRKIPLTFGSLFNIPGPEAPKINMERAHAPPAAHMPLALIRISIYFARSSLVKSSRIVPYCCLSFPVPSPSITIDRQLMTPPVPGACALLRGSVCSTAFLSTNSSSFPGGITNVCC